MKVMGVLKNKEYVYHFIGGGWNTEWAKTKRGAIKQAKLRWKESKTLIVDEKSFHQPYKDEVQQLCSSFY